MIGGRGRPPVLDRRPDPSASAPTRRATAGGSSRPRRELVAERGIDARLDGRRRPRRVRRHRHAVPPLRRPRGARARAAGRAHARVPGRADRRARRRSARARRPRERLHAFGDGYLDLLERHADMLGRGARRRARADGPDAALRDAPRDPAARGGAATSTPSSPRGRCSRCCTPAHHLHARRALGWSLERLARRVARVRRRADLCAALRRRRPRSASGRAEARHERASPPTPTMRWARPARMSASPPGPSRCSTLPTVSAQRPADHAQERVLVGPDAQRLPAGRRRRRSRSRASRRGPRRAGAGVGIGLGGDLRSAHGRPCSAGSGEADILRSAAPPVTAGGTRLGGYGQLPVYTSRGVRCNTRAHARAAHEDRRDPRPGDRPARRPRPAHRGRASTARGSTARTDGPDDLRRRAREVRAAARARGPARRAAVRPPGPEAAAVGRDRAARGRGRRHASRSRAADGARGRDRVGGRLRRLRRRSSPSARRSSSATACRASPSSASRTARSRARVVSPGPLAPRKGINVTYARPELPAITEKDLADLDARRRDGAPTSSRCRSCARRADMRAAARRCSRERGSHARGDREDREGRGLRAPRRDHRRRPTA